jgi:acetyl-CoA carboxylase biotin carboxyl carrier protein
MSNDPVPPPPGGDLLAVVHAVGELLHTVGARPSLIQVNSGDLAVHLEWHDAGQAATGAAGPVPPAQPAAEGDAWHYFTAPLVGVFYRAKEPGAQPFADVGDHVVAGQQIAIIEAMKLMLPVEADRDGTITDVLQADGSPVEYGARLFAVAPGGAP